MNDLHSSPKIVGDEYKVTLTASESIGGRSPRVTLNLHVDAGVIRGLEFDAIGSNQTAVAAGALQRLTVNKKLHESKDLSPTALIHLTGGTGAGMEIPAAMVFKAFQRARSQFAESVLADFDRRFGRLLAHRASTFRQAFQLLLRQEKDDYLIVETGTCRVKDNWTGDGQSTRLFDWFVNWVGGTAYSVDVDSGAVDVARSLTGERTTVIAGDSVSYLWNAKFARPIDLLYLDSMDIDPTNPHESALHHLKELAAAAGKLRKNSIVLADDWFNDSAAKGLYVADFFQDIGAIPLFREYQVAWLIP